MRCPLFAKQFRRTSYDRQLGAVSGACVWTHCRGLRHLGPQLDPFPGRGQCPHAGNRSGYSDGSRRLFVAAVPHHCRRWRHSGGADCPVPGPAHRQRICARRGVVGRLRLHRHECVRARQRAHRAGGYGRYWCRAGRRLPRRRHYRHASRRAGPAGRHRLLLVSGARWHG